MVHKLLLDEVLAIKYPEAVKWSPDGRCLSFVWDDGGVKDLYICLVKENKVKRLTDLDGVVSSPNWSVDGKSIIFIHDDDLWTTEVETGKTVRLTKTQGKETFPVWSPKGPKFCYVKDGDIWVHTWVDQSITQFKSEGNILRCPKWSPDGEKIAFTSLKDNITHVGVLSIKSEEILWKTTGNNEEGMPIWLPDSSGLLYGRRLIGGCDAQYRLINLKNLEDILIFEEKDEKGVHLREPSLSPDGKNLIFVSSKDGWDHLWLKLLKNGEPIQLTKGEHEDTGLGNDSPIWSPDGEKIAFSSNKGSLGQRQIWTMTLQGDLQKVTSIPGTNISPKWSPDGNNIAFIHADPYKSIDLWLLDLTKQKKPIQLTKSMPESFTKEIIVVPEEVVYKSAEGWNIHAWLFKPKKIIAKIKYPAIIWVHGGPTRQMRYGWHPMPAYSIFYTFHQYLLQKGYVVLSVNFRGGIGYGKKFTQGIHLSMGVNDCLDVVNGAKYLKSLDFVDPERIAVWGISYGGFLTLQLLAKYPDLFRLGINFAGIINFVSWTKWAEKNYPGACNAFKPQLGGEPEDNPKAYYEASAINFVKNIKTPLINFQGTKDEAVTFKQMDEIITAMVENGKYFKVHYYPGESHAFRSRKVWKDAFSNVEEYFENYLKSPL